jgi:CSLREA domain-containing protein
VSERPESKTDLLKKKGTKQMITSTPNRATRGRGLALAFLVAALVASLMLAAGPAQASTTFTVNSTADHSDQNLDIGACDTGYTVKGAGGEQVPECTLRAAIEQANYTPGTDTMNFNIPDGGVQTIAPESALSTITQPVTINGYSQPGAHPNTRAVGSDADLKIELSGASAPPGADGLRITAANSTVRGLVINRWGAPGSIENAIRISGSGATGNRVAGNYIGTDASGTQDLGNAGVGVYVSDAPNNTIGGTAVAARNVISGNSYGVGLGGAAKGTTVAGNFIGTDASGKGDLGNSEFGVAGEGGSNSVIGGTTSAERNVISGNDAGGIGFAANGVRIAGNYVGTDASGTKALGNNFFGVYIDSGSNNIVGGTSAAERNVISGNDGSGVLIADSDTNANKVLGNFIGADKNGAAVLGNSANGVSIYGSNNTVVGSAKGGGRNVISGNKGSGVSIYGDTAMGNRVLSNSIFANAGLAIDLGDDGPTPNDAGDTDTGPNNLQNKPVLSSAKKSATGTTIKGSLNSTPNKIFKVRFFSNPEGTDEGKTFLGTKSVSTNGTGNVSFTFSTKKQIGLGQNITATATSPGGNTSEFSGPRKVVAR